jgi:hypothetical protein
MTSLERAPRTPPDDRQPTSGIRKSESGRDAALGMQALQRLGKPEDIAGIVAFVACGEALDHGSHYSGRWRIEALTSCLRIISDLVHSGPSLGRVQPWRYPRE